MSIVTFFLIWICWGAVHGVLGIMALYNVKDRKDQGLEPETNIQSKLYDSIDEVGAVIDNPYRTISVVQFLTSLLIGPIGTVIWIWENIYTWVNG